MVHYLHRQDIGMEIIKATHNCIEEIVEIYHHAREYMRSSGNANQWTGGYPDKDTVIADIQKDRLYLCVENGDICGVFCYFFGNDPTYDKIYNGDWLNQNPYGVIHRIAVSEKYHGKGVAGYCFDYCFSLCNNLKIDTHPENIPMQRSLAKNGFLYCGEIYLESGSLRIAFQKI